MDKRCRIREHLSLIAVDRLEGEWLRSPGGWTILAGLRHGPILQSALSRSQYGVRGELERMWAGNRFYSQSRDCDWQPYANDEISLIDPQCPMGHARQLAASSFCQPGTEGVDPHVATSAFTGAAVAWISWTLAWYIL